MAQNKELGSFINPKQKMGYEPDGKNRILYGGTCRRSSWNFNIFQGFIQTIKQGKTAIILSMDYVVIDRKSYESLLPEPAKREIVYNEMPEFEDECSYVTREEFERVMKKLRRNNGSNRKSNS